MVLLHFISSPITPYGMQRFVQVCRLVASIQKQDTVVFAFASTTNEFVTSIHLPNLYNSQIECRVRSLINYSFRVLSTFNQ